MLTARSSKEWLNWYFCESGAGNGCPETILWKDFWRDRVGSWSILHIFLLTNYWCGGRSCCSWMQLILLAGQRTLQGFDRVSREELKRPRRQWWALIKINIIFIFEETIIVCMSYGKLEYKTRLPKAPTEKRVRGLDWDAHVKFE